MDIFKRIKNHNLLYDIYGYWPGFHDAEIIEFKGEGNASGTEENYGPTFTMAIHVFELTGKVDSEGYYVSGKHNLVYFKFNDVYGWEFDGFDVQNVILEMDISLVKNEDLKRDCIRFVFDPACGLGGELTCASAEILSVIPCDKNGIAHNVPSP